MSAVLNRCSKRLRDDDETACLGELKGSGIELSVASARLEELKSKVERKLGQAERMRLLLHEVDQELEARV